MIGAGFIGGIGQRSAPALGISDRPIFGDRGRKSGTDPNEGRVPIPWTRSARIASTRPSRSFGTTEAAPDSAAQAAE